MSKKKPTRKPIKAAKKPQPKKLTDKPLPGKTTKKRLAEKMKEVAKRKADPTVKGTLISPGTVTTTTAGSRAASTTRPTAAKAASTTYLTTTPSTTKKAVATTTPSSKTGASAKKTPPIKLILTPEQRRLYQEYCEQIKVTVAPLCEELWMEMHHAHEEQIKFQTEHPYLPTQETISEALSAD